MWEVYIIILICLVGPIMAYIIIRRDARKMRYKRMKFYSQDKMRNGEVGISNEEEL